MTWVRGGGILQPPEGTAPPFAPRGVLTAWSGLRASSLLPAAGPVSSGNDKTLWVGASQVNGGRVFQGEGATGAKSWGVTCISVSFGYNPSILTAGQGQALVETKEPGPSCPGTP